MTKTGGVADQQTQSAKAQEVAEATGNRSRENVEFWGFLNGGKALMNLTSGVLVGVVQTRKKSEQEVLEKGQKNRTQLCHVIQQIFGHNTGRNDGLRGWCQDVKADKINSWGIFANKWDSYIILTG